MFSGGRFSMPDMTEPRHDKTNNVAVRPAKTQISRGIRPVWSESSLLAWRKLGSLASYWAHSEDSDQTGQMPRLIWVFAGCTLILLVLSCHGSRLYRDAHTTPTLTGDTSPTSFLYEIFQNLAVFHQALFLHGYLWVIKQTPLCIKKCTTFSKCLNFTSDFPKTLVTGVPLDCVYCVCLKWSRHFCQNTFCVCRVL